MSQENNNQHKPDSGSHQEQVTTRRETAAGTTSSWKKLLRKKWVFPAAYMAAAAIILSLMWAYQGSEPEQNALTDAELTGGGLIADSENPSVTDSVSGDDALPVTVPAESMQWPFADDAAMDVIMPFYEETADAATKQAATIQYNNTFMFNTGLALAHQNEEAFEVLAALSGTVTRAEQLPLIGNVVEITHEDGLKTVYQSLGEMKVKQNDRVTQGMVIGTAGRNELHRDLGVHLHFEVQDNEELVNPESYLPALRGMELDEPEAEAEGSTGIVPDDAATSEGSSETSPSNDSSTEEAPEDNTQPESSTTEAD